MQPLYSQMCQATVKGIALKMGSAVLMVHTSYLINWFCGNTIQLHFIHFYAQSTQIQVQGCDWWLPDFIHFIDTNWGLLWGDKHCWCPEIWTLVFKRCCKYHSTHKTFNTLLLCAVAVWQDMPADKSVLLDLLPSFSSAKATNQKAFLNKTSIPGRQY